MARKFYRLSRRRIRRLRGFVGFFAVVVVAVLISTHMAPKNTPDDWKKGDTLVYRGMYKYPARILVRKIDRNHVLIKEVFFKKIDYKIIKYSPLWSTKDALLHTRQENKNLQRTQSFFQQADKVEQRKP